MKFGFTTRRTRFRFESFRQWALITALAVAPVGVAQAQDPVTSLEPLAHVDVIRGVPLRALLADTTDPQLRKVALWLDLRDGAPGVTFEDIRRFLTDNPEWPARSALKRRAEDLLVADPGADAVALAWFERWPPQSRDGQQRYADALRNAGRAAEAERVLRAAWIDGTFLANDEKRFLERYGHGLTLADHLTRLDRLLWRGLTGEAQRQAARVGPEARRIAEARVKLQTNAKDAEAAARALPLTDAGLIFDYARWNRRRNNPTEVERLLLLTPAQPSTIMRQELWWQERESAIRRALDDGRSEIAYRLAADHRLNGGTELADAEFLAGWIALRERRDPVAAARHFQKLVESVRYPVSLSRGNYWLGRAERAQGHADRAALAFANAAKFPTTFYGQLAAAELGSGRPLDLPRDPAPGAAEISAFVAGEFAQITRKLALAGAADRVDPFVNRLAEQATTPEAAVLVARLARGVSRPDLAVAVGRRVQGSGIVLVDVNFPSLPIEPGAVEPALVLAVIRQESAFAVDAISPVGARGLMQLMPATAKAVATKAGLPYQRDRLTDDGAYNISLGRAYLGQLVDDFAGSYLLAAVSYNAGPGRAIEWIGRHGDPRTETVDPIDWIEKIPFGETRNYAQRVLEGLQVYRLRGGGAGNPASVEPIRASTDPAALNAVAARAGVRWCVLACAPE